ncbi:DUF4340 domain-containing protein [Pseudomonas sp. HLT2-19-2]
MRGISLVGLSVACALFIGALVHLLPAPAAEPPPNAPWLPELKVGTVSALVIARPGQADIRAERRDGRWVLTSWQDFPAAPSGIVTLLRALDSARQVEAQSSLPQHLETLGLSEQASRLTLERQGQAPLELWLGKQVQQGGQLVRRGDDDTPWLLDSHLPLPQSPVAWIDRHLTRIPFEQIRQLSLSYPNGARLKIYRDSARQPLLKVSQYPTRPRVMDEAGANDLARLFGQLTISDVAADTDLDLMKRPDLSFELLTFSGGKLSGQMRQRDGQFWVKLKTIQGFAPERVNPHVNRVLRVEGPLVRRF